MSDLQNIINAWTILCEEAGESFAQSLDDNKRAAWDAMEQAVSEATSERVHVQKSGDEHTCPYGHEVTAVVHESIDGLRQFILQKTNGTYSWADYEDDWQEGAEIRSQDNLPVLTCQEGHYFTHQDIPLEAIS